jgi:hypothetical protein
MERQNDGTERGKEEVKKEMKSLKEDKGKRSEENGWKGRRERMREGGRREEKMDLLNNVLNDCLGFDHLFLRSWCQEGQKKKEARKEDKMKKGRSRKEGRTDGRKEGRQSKEGRKLKEGRKEGRSRKAGRKTRKADQGRQAGRKIKAGRQAGRQEGKSKGRETERRKQPRAAPAMPTLTGRMRPMWCAC